MINFRQQVAERLAATAQLTAEQIYEALEKPPQAELGDWALPCFKLAKTLRKSPQVIAAELAAGMEPLPDFIDHIEQKGGYVNIFLDSATVVKRALQETLDPAKTPGFSDDGAGETVIVEYSSPNIAKPFHIGHAFTTILGESLARLYSSQGYTVRRYNHLGDYGTQFGKLIVAYENWVDEAALEAAPIDELSRIYVRFHQEVKDRPELEDEARDRFRQLEAGGEAESALWQRFRDLSLHEFNRLYERLDIRFDNLNGESYYSSMIPDVVTKLRDKGLLTRSEGADVVMLDDLNLPPCMILKSDGTTIYASRDIAAILWRWNQEHFAHNIYVVGLPQQLHFRQVFAVVERLGYPCAKNCEHVGFGTVHFSDGKMSSREGNVILLEDLLDEAVAKTRAIIDKNNQARGGELDEAQIDETAERVGLAAIQYTYLRSGRERDIAFSWDEVLDFDGDTAPYLLYSYARARSILRKAGHSSEAEAAEAVCDGLDTDLLTDPHEVELADCFIEFPQALRQAVTANEPFMVSRAISQMARVFNRYYSNVPVLTVADTALRDARIALLAAFCRVLRTGLELLGIRTVDRM